MLAQKLPAEAGWRWIKEGFAIYRRNPPLMAMLVVTYWLSVVFLNLIPLVGVAAAALAVPGLSVGLMQAARDLGQGKPIGFPTLFGGLRQNPRTLCLLGTLYLCATLGILALSALADGGDLLHLILDGKGADREAIESGDLRYSSLFAMVLLIPVMMAWWFAPVLAAWHGQGVGKSLFFSLVACAINWRPFLTYGIGLSPILILVWFMAQPSPASLLILLLMLLLVIPVVFASFYAIYRDIFGQPEAS